MNENRAVRAAKFNLPGYHKGDIGTCKVWYFDLRHVTLSLDGMYKASEKSPLIWIAGKTEYAGKEGRNTGKFKVKYDVWSTFTGVTPYLTSNTVSGVVVTDDDNTLKDVSEAFMNNAMKTVNDLISKMRSKGIN